MINADVWGLERSSPIPLYYQLACRLRDKIQKGVQAPGKRLPTEHELARQAGISRLTARHCYTLLEKDGLISRFRSKGTYIARDRTQELITARKNVLFLTFVEKLDSYFARVLKGVENGLNAGRCNMMVKLAPGNELDTVRNVIESRPDGLLWMWWDHGQAPALIREIQAAGLPLVLVDSRVDRMRADCVGIDFEWGIERLVCQLAEQGCRRIHLLNVGHRSSSLIMCGQEQAFKKAVTAAGLKQAACQAGHLEMTMAEALKIEPALDAIARRHAQYDALILVTILADPLDYARYLWTKHGAAMAGKKVGLMLSDAHSAVSLVGLPLVSVLRPDYEMGRKAAALILQRLRGQGPRGPQTILLRS